MAIPFDLGNARWAVILEMRDIQELQRIPLPAAERANLTDRLAVLHLYLEELDLLVDPDYQDPPRRALVDQGGDYQNAELDQPVPGRQLPEDDPDEGETDGGEEIEDGDEGGANEDGADEDGANEDRPDQDRLNQDEANQDGVNEDGADQDGANLDGADAESAAGNNDEDRVQFNIEEVANTNGGDEGPVDAAEAGLAVEVAVDADIRIDEHRLVDLNILIEADLELPIEGELRIDAALPVEGALPDLAGLQLDENLQAPALDIQDPPVEGGLAGDPLVEEGPEEVDIQANAGAPVEAQNDQADQNGVGATDEISVEAAEETQPDAMNEDGEVAQEPSLENQITCHICYGENQALNMVTVEHCQHKWCGMCICDAFENAIKTEADWPPKCCQEEIAQVNAAQLMSLDLQTRYTTKSLEWSTPNRTYCWRNRCLTFIRWSVGQRATCPACGGVTCTVCKQEYHWEYHCSDTENDKLLRELAKKENLRQCYNCGKMVELTHGCFHIVCHCRAEFCYLCGLRWKTCRCVRQDERYLICRD